MSLFSYVMIMAVCMCVCVCLCLISLANLSVPCRKDPWLSHFYITALSSVLKISSIKRRNTFDPWTTWGLGTPTFPTVKNPHITFDQASVYVVPQYLKFASWDSTLTLTLILTLTAEHCSTAVFNMEKNPRVSGPMQSKPMLFKDHLSMNTALTQVLFH